VSLVYWLLGLPSPGTIVHSTGWVWYAASPVGTSTLVFLIVLGLCVAGLNLLPQNVMPWSTRFTLTIVRMVGFGLLVLMLCQLELRLELERVVRPQVAVLTDISGSMGVRDMAGKTRLEAARGVLDDLLASIGNRADLIEYTFNWRLEGRSARTVSEPAGSTRLIDALAEVARREADLHAVVILSDGNDTTGNRGALVAPLLAARRIPVYPVVLGDPNAPRLVSVKITGAGEYVRLGDELRLVATLTAHGLDGQAVTVRLLEEGNPKPLATRENVRLGKGPVEVAFVTKPDKAGVKTYRIVTEGVRGSVSERSLVAERRVEVVNSKIRVLYLDIPRDERKILGHWLSVDPVVDLATLTMLPKGGWYAQGALQHENAGDGLPNQEAELCRYDVVILGDIPRSYFRSGGDVSESKLERLAEFVSRRGGGLITLGGRSVYAAGQYHDSALARILPFTIEPTDKPQVPYLFKITPTAAGLSHPLMQLEWEPEANREAWYDLPPLDGCNRVGRIKPGASLLAVRTLDEGPMPMIAIQNVGKGRVLSLAVDTTWRWEMLRPEEGEDYFRRFWGNAVRVLAPDPRITPNRPQVLRSQSATPVGQTITLSTRLVDSLYKPIRGADLVVKVTSPSGKVTNIYPCDGRQAPGLYEYDIPLDEPGQWEVAAKYKDHVVVERIAAGESTEELDDPRSRPEELAELAEATGGKLLRPDEAPSSLVKMLELEGAGGQGRRLTQTVSVPVWNLPVTLALFVALVCADCYVRKRRGMV